MATNTAQKKKIAQLKAKYLEYYRQLPNQLLAAAKVGRDEDTIIRWRKEDTDFSDLCDEAKADWALAKSKRVKSEEWLLDRVMNDYFGQKTKSDITSGGQKIEFIVGRNTNDDAEKN